MITSLNALAEQIRFFNGQKGFERPSTDIHRKLLLAVSEICEAQEDLRDGHSFTDQWYGENGKPCGFGFEIADAIIRLLDIAHDAGLDIEDCIETKLGYNMTRPPKHGRKF